MCVCVYVCVFSCALVVIVRGVMVLTTTPITMPCYTNIQIHIPSYRFYLKVES